MSLPKCKSEYLTDSGESDTVVVMLVERVLCGDSCLIPKTPKHNAFLSSCVATHTSTSLLNHVSHLYWSLNCGACCLCWCQVSCRSTPSVFVLTPLAHFSADARNLHLLHLRTRTYAHVAHVCLHTHIVVARARAYFFFGSAQCSFPPLFPFQYTHLVRLCTQW